MFIEQTNSTNTLIKEMVARGEPFPDEPIWIITGYVRAGYQTAGRGQAGNGWESEPNKNLLCSILMDISRWHLSLSPFCLSMTVCNAIHQLVGSLLSQAGVSKKKLSIKWPNDIYWGDKKLAGILIENMYDGCEIRHMIAGIGLNVNQTEFKSDAPNPVSLKQITGRDYDLDELMNRLLSALDKALMESGEEYYKAHLYRKDGYWPFVEREVTTEPTMNADQQIEGQFMAQIEDILADGEIVLKDQEGKERIYHFKQIRYVV